LEGCKDDRRGEVFVLELRSRDNFIAASGNPAYKILHATCPFDHFYHFIVDQRDPSNGVYYSIQMPQKRSPALANKGRTVE
jgi:hypothetical protein